MFFLAETVTFAFAQLPERGGVGFAVVAGGQLVVRRKEAKSS